MHCLSNIPPWNGWMEGSYMQGSKEGYVDEKLIAETLAGWLAGNGWERILYMR